MLKTMRKNLKSLAPALWFVIAAFIISIFAVWGGAGRLGESRAVNTLVTIGKEKISTDLYIQNLRQRLEIMKREFEDLDSNYIQQLNVPQQILEQIIQQTLLLQTAREMRLGASDEEIREKIISYPVFQKDGKFIGFEEYKRILDWNHIPLSEFENSLKKEIILDKVIKILTAGITISQQEIWENYKNKNESVGMEYILLENDKIELNEEPQFSELQDFYEKNKENFKVPEKREGIFAFTNSEDLKKNIELTYAEIEDYYKDNQPQFSEPEKIKLSRIFLPYEQSQQEEVLTEAQKILNSINDGHDFADLAKKYSKDEKAETGGNWGLYEWKSLSQQEQEEIEKLSNGEISEAIELEDGVSILKITEKEPSTIKPLEAVKERITNILRDQKARDSSDKKMAQLENSAKKEKNLDVASQQHGFKTKSTGLLKENEAIEDIDPSGTISRALFNLEEKEVSSLIYTYTGVGLAQLQKIEPPRQASFEEAQEEVKKDFVSTKKKEKCLERLEKARADLRGGSLEALAEKYGFEFKTLEEHKRGQYLSIIGENQEIDRLAFTLPLNETSDPVEFETGFVMIRPLKRKEITQNEFEKDKETEKETLLETERNKFLQSMMLKLREEKGVNIKYDLLVKINSDILSRFSPEE
ncbi:SurA N-terminal domain-containing protein [Acidobacteriota bacterium]